MVLYGHRSIVNQVRYNPQKCVIASSGVEKIIKLWSPFEAEGWKGSLTEETNDNPRELFTHDEYVSLVNASGPNITHDYANQNTFEDTRMMAFFDSLVTREIEGWKSDPNSESDKSSEHSSDGSSRPTSTETSDSEDGVFHCETSNGRLKIKPRTIYHNRIAYLIATKRNKLKRLALKGSGQIERRVKSAKLSRKLSIQITRKGGSGNRSGRTKKV